MPENAPIDTNPATFAEGVPVPTEVPDSQNAVPTPAPTDEDIAREWGTWRAAADLFVDGNRAVAKGGKVPASHPSVPMWRSHGLLERADGQTEQATPTADEVSQPADPKAAAQPLPTRKGRERDA
jgi:hypothetical protein